MYFHSLCSAVLVQGQEEGSEKGVIGEKIAERQGG